MLWIAFKNYYLRDEEQPSHIIVQALCSCELLSKIIIFVTRNNRRSQKAAHLGVVNCFQKLLSSWRGTTPHINWGGSQLLWIAFKNYYLRDEEQRCKYLSRRIGRCELLSKIIIFVTRNNMLDVFYDKKDVVNCFQKLLSSWRGTTFLTDLKTLRELWIAFKNYYLRDEEQPDMAAAAA